MLTSPYNIMYSIRIVTVVTKGRKTPGVYNRIFKGPKEQIQLYEDVCCNRELNELNPSPAKRVMIPKRTVDKDHLEYLQ